MDELICVRDSSENPFGLQKIVANSQTPPRWNAQEIKNKNNGSIR